MIIAHFFTRKVRDKLCLYVETTSSTGLEQPAPVPLKIAEVSVEESRNDWVRKALYAFQKDNPELVLLEVMENDIRLKSDKPAFDLIFRPKRLLGRPADNLAKLQGKSSKPSSQEAKCSKATNTGKSKKHRYIRRSANKSV